MKKKKKKKIKKNQKMKENKFKKIRFLIKKKSIEINLINN